MKTLGFLRNRIGAFQRAPSRRWQADADAQKRWTETDRFIAERLVHSDAALEAVLEASHAAELPSKNVTPNQGKLLMLLAKAIEAKAILEIGTLGGYSTVWLARALPPKGRLIALEADPKHVAVARANIARAGLTDRIEVRQGFALDLLTDLTAERPFDLIFIDADKQSLPKYIRCALELSRQGTLIVVDNVVRGVTDADYRKPGIEGVRQFYDVVKAEPRLSMTAIQTVGGKGHDGFAIGLVTTDPVAGGV